MPTAGTHSVERLHAAASRYTEINAQVAPAGARQAPRLARGPRRGLPGAGRRCAELVRSWVSAGKTEALGELEDILVALHLAVLAGRPWPAEKD